MQDQSPLLKMEDILVGNVQLASPPEVFVKINQALDDPAKSVGDVSWLIEHDPGLSARLLRIGNDPHFHLSSKVISVTQTIDLIGEREVRNLVLATLVVDRFSSQSAGLMSLRQWWLMSVRCALTCQALANRHPDRARLGPLYRCGLLHDIGRLVIYHRVPELASAAVTKARSEGIDERQAERVVMGFDHYQVGAELARRWRLPEVIVAAIEHHRLPDASKRFRQEILLVALASRLSTIDGNDRELLESRLPAADSPFWQRISLPKAKIEEVLAEVDTVYQDVYRRIFGD